jgi:hypothetical protein
MWPRLAADYAARVFTLDVRSLALMRIAVATTVLVDLLVRLVHAGEHYSDAGVLPRDAARSIHEIADWSLLAASGSLLWTAAVFALAIILAGAVLVGFHTRVATLLLWLVVLSIQHRNPLLWDHRDAMFCCALCCGVLLPWGRAWSLDARRDGASERRYLGIPAAAYVVQVACIYLFAAVLKDGSAWRSDFTAVEHAVGVEYWAKPAASFLLDHPTVAAILTAAVLGFEAAVALLLLSPWRSDVARWIAIVGLCALQVGFAGFLWLDTFPMIAGALVLGLVPSSAWSRGRASVPAIARERSRPLSVAAIVVLGYTLALNVMSLDREARVFVVARRPAELLGIDQHWNMFAPAPTRLDGWFLVLAHRPDGTTIDLLTGRPATEARPSSFREGIRTTRELVYMRRLLATDDATRVHFAAARCRTAEPHAATIAVYFVPVIDGQRRAPELLIAHACQGTGSIMR